MAAVRFPVWRNPEAGPPGAVTPKAERWKALSSFVTCTGFPQDLCAWLSDLEVSPLLVIAAMMLVYVVLGMLLESLSMLLLTLPVFFPVVQALGLDPVWFGLVVVVVTEISLITPPVGLNVFVLSATVPDISTRTIFKGVTPFWTVDIIRLALLILIPSISLWLPSLLYR